MSDDWNPRDRRNFLKLIKDARIGDPSAQYEVAVMYANGVGVERNLRLAHSWATSAAERGHLAAQYLAGHSLLSGTGVLKNEGAAMGWLIRAAERGHEKAAFKLAKIFAKAQPGVFLHYCKQAAESGLAEAQLMLAEFYERDAPLHLQDRSLARQWLSKAADQGSVVARFQLARFLEDEGCDEANLDLARNLYRRASMQGLPAAQLALSRLDRVAGGRSSARKRLRQRERRAADGPWPTYAESGTDDDRYCLGCMYRDASGVEKNLVQAQFWFERAAVKGHTVAQLALGELMESSAPLHALMWYEAAASSGNAQAQYEAGRMRADRRGHHHDSALAFSWYAKAADQRHARAQWALATSVVDGDDDLRLSLTKHAAKAGMSQAQYDLGCRHTDGRGVERNPTLASDWYRRAAESGYAPAQAALAGNYAAGIGVVKDLAAAVQWYESASNQGYAPAQWTLGEMYASGFDGVPKNTRKALLLCKLAAESNFGPAQSTLGVLFARAKKYDRAFYWFRRAAEVDDLEALFNLAAFHAEGKGIERNINLAFGLWLHAAHLGLTEAQARVGLCYATGEGVAQDRIEATKWFLIATKGGNTGAIANSKLAISSLSTPEHHEASRRAQEFQRLPPKKVPV